MFGEGPDTLCGERAPIGDVFAEVLSNIVENPAGGILAVDLLGLDPVSSSLVKTGIDIACAAINATSGIISDVAAMFAK